MPVQSFWSSEDKVPISQTKISIPSDNGLSYSDGQRMIFTIPADHEYINPINTVLEMDFKITSPAGAKPTRLQLDAELGGSVLIRDIRLYGNTAEMPLLEEIQGCNILAALRYDYDANDNIRKKRAIAEGCGLYDPKHRSVFKNTQSLGNYTENSPYFQPNVDASALEFNAAGGPTFKTAKLLLPLHQSGIFGSSVVFPNKLVGGMRLEIILEEGRRCFRQVNNVKLWNRGENCPRFHSIDGQDAGGAAQNWAAGGAGSQKGEFYISRINNFTSVESLGLCVGEPFSIKDTLNAAYITWIDAAGATCVPFVRQLDLMPVVAGQTHALIRVTIGTVNAANTCSPSIAITGEGTATHTGRYAIYSTCLNAYVGTKDAGVTDYAPTYEVSNCALLVERVEMPPAYTSKMTSAMKSGGTINYDFLSFTNYRYSQLKDDRVANIRVPIMNTRCKSTLCIPVDASVINARDTINCGNGDERGGVNETRTYYIDQEGTESQTVTNLKGNFENYSERSGLVGIADGLSKISNRVSISQQPIIELEKALAVSGIAPHSFSQFRNNFCVGRAVGLQSGVTDLSTTDYNLQLEYNETGNVPTKNKTWNIFIGHLRRLAIKGDSVMLIV